MNLKALTLVVILSMSLLVVSDDAMAGGNSPGHLASKGWLCINAGPDDYVHCFPPGAFSSDATLTVMVFETTDVGDEDAHFLGTEILIRDDLYEGQPCSQNGGEEYEFLPSAETGLPVDYRACHHYSTSH